MSVTNTEAALNNDIERVAAVVAAAPVSITVRVKTYDRILALRGVKSTDRVVEQVEKRMPGDLFVRRLVEDPNGQPAAGRAGLWAWSSEEPVAGDDTFESLGIQDGSREELVLKERPGPPEAPKGCINIKVHPDFSFEVGSAPPNDGLLMLKTVPSGNVPLYGMPYEAVLGAIVSKILVAGDEVAARLNKPIHMV